MERAQFDLPNHEEHDHHIQHRRNRVYQGIDDDSHAFVMTDEPQRTQGSQHSQNLQRRLVKEKKSGKKSYSYERYVD